MKVLFLILAWFVITIGCTTPTGEEKSTQSKDPASDKTLSEEAEKKVQEYKAEVEIGRNMAGRLLQFYGTIENQEVIEYLNILGSYLVRFSDFPERKIMFQILDTELVNAFACPGGYILITLGTLRHAANEAEIAAVLGHEIAHVGLKHMLHTLASMDDKNKTKASEKIELEENKATPMEVRIRKRPAAEDSAAANLIARYLTGSAALGLNVLKAAKIGMSVMLEDGLASNFEHEADENGVKMAVNAGYDPFALIHFLTRLEQQKQTLNVKILSKTHPPMGERKGRIAKILLEMKVKEIVGAQGKDRFLKTKNLLPPIKKVKS
jgi:beta-barrel assembly-enhancing protease